MRTAAASALPQSFVWTADTAGQGYGINPEIGGMRGYAAMHATRPDFFLHSGDTIYADNPLEPTLEVPSEPLSRNEVTEEVSKVAETLAEFRGRHRYNMMDTNLRALYAEVPVIAQWDDHETTNNWWPGEVLDDPRYTQVRDVDTLAARGRQAWQEYMPIADSRALRRSTGFEPARIHRKIPRGPHLDVFALDMRTFKSENTNGLEPHETDILGEEQTRWLIHELCRSRATWKVIGNDLPLGLVVPDGKGQESTSNANHGAPLGRELQLARVLKAIKDHRIKNVVFLTGTCTTARPTTTPRSERRSRTSRRSGSSWPGPSTPVPSAPTNWTARSAPAWTSSRPVRPWAPRARASTSTSDT